jgi:hypothetical protein
MEAPLLLPISTASSCIEIAEGAVPSGPRARSSSSMPSAQSFVLRVVTVVAVACASLFAQHEAGKGFAVSVANDLPRGSAAARRFDLLLVSNGRAERALLRASRAVERALFPDPSFPRRQVRRVTVRMAARNLTGAAVHSAAPGEYVVSLGPGLASSAPAAEAALRRAIARVWLWDGRGAAPARVTESMVDYLASAAAEVEVEVEAPPSAGGCGMSARLLRLLEARREGFVARLNRAMRDRWSDAAVDAALGAPARLACHDQKKGATALTGRGTTTSPRRTPDAARGSSVAT